MLRVWLGSFLKGRCFVNDTFECHAHAAKERSCWLVCTSLLIARFSSCATECVRGFAIVQRLSDGSLLL